MNFVAHNLRPITDTPLAGKRVLLRTSLNVPILANGEVGDLFRLKRALKTIEYVARQGAQVIIVGYLGREGESLAPVAQALQSLAPHVKIKFTAAALEQVLPEAEALQPGECLMLENMRRLPGEENPPTGGDPALAAQLASLADIFVDDAFAEAHRAYASNVGVAKLLPAYAGFLMCEEVARLSEALTPPQNAVAIVGGAKFETKEPLIQKLLAAYPMVLIGGALADDVLKSRGAPVGASLVSGMPIPESVSGNDKLLVPVDVVVREGSANAERTVLVNDIRAGESIVDIGPRTAEAWAADLATKEFVLWNGPMGVYESGFTAGTDALARALVSSNARAVLGGGDTVAALSRFAFDTERIFVSTGGGAMLEFLADGTLPALEVLRASKE